MRAVREDGRTPLRSRRDPFWLNACRQTFLQLRQAKCGMYLKGGTQLMRLSYSQQALVSGCSQAALAPVLQQPHRTGRNAKHDGTPTLRSTVHPLQLLWRTGGEAQRKEGNLSLADRNMADRVRQHETQTQPFAASLLCFIGVLRDYLGALCPYIFLSTQPLPVLVILEDGLPPVAPVHRMINRPGVLNGQLPSAQISAPHSHPVKKTIQSH